MTDTTQESLAVAGAETAQQALEHTNSAAAASHSPAAQPNTPWVNWVLPSISDVFFLVLIFVLTFRTAGTGVLSDADTGWHIRNGEQILSTHIVPRVDPFSYTRAGQPWFAWEWLFDAVIAAIHHVAGLNGVVLFTLFLACGTFSLLFRFALRRCGNLVVAVVLTLLAAISAQVHLLARPHILSWLFSLLWIEILYRFEEGRSKLLFWLPLIMLVWVNVHGGFILGLVFTGIFGVAALWRWMTRRLPGDLRRVRQLAVVWIVCLATTLLTPYGYELHVHVYKYLSSSFLMNSIDEFSSPNFHAVGMGYFEALLLMSVAACALAWRRLEISDLLLLLFSMHAALFAARNIPISAILMCFALCRVVASAVSPAEGVRSRPAWANSLLSAIDDISTNMTGMEKQFRGHLLVIAVVVASCAVALNGGRFLGAQAMSNQFDPEIFPVQATNFIAQRGIHDHLYSTDRWSGYLIYRLYPSLHLFFDDRHDFYGEAFIREYLQPLSADPRWREPLDKYQVKWVLLPPNFPLVSLLTDDPSWKVEYRDKVAILFSRRDFATSK
jgi:hypothetical protein